MSLTADGNHCPQLVSLPQTRKESQVQDAAEHQTQGSSVSCVWGLCCVWCSWEMEQRTELVCLNAVPAPLTLPGFFCECSTGKEGAKNWLLLTA